MPTKMPYYKEIGGDEARNISAQFLNTWGYNGSYWYPLEEMPSDDKLFIAPKWVELHLDEIYHLLGLPQNSVYLYAESFPSQPACAEVNELLFYNGCESAHCPKDFSWIIYFSHENTVTFAGTIVPQIKQIFANEKVHWNQWEPWSPD